ncbi:MAG TPA: DNA recombination protein RmuC [Clostridiales bacterium]|nr:DNA recombination protein RmuC [Clostridiales bacterium]
MIPTLLQKWPMAGSSINLPDLSGPVLLLISSLLLILAIVLTVIVWRLIRQQRESRLAERVLREDISHLSQDFSRQLELMQNNIASRVAESNRDQREVNALFLGQLQQLGQGSGQQLESVRRSVAESLGKVSGSLLEMQNVTAEVRSLKQILGNVKTRGIIGELQLERLLEDILAPGQFDRNVRIRSEKQETIEFVIRIPGGGEQKDPVLLPIDAKFPMDYLSRLLYALDAGDLESAEIFRRDLNSRIRQEAKKIAELYLLPPKTTDFAILYLPTETLFAEVVREADLIAEIYRNYRIIITGPSSMTAMLAGLQATFRLQALEQKSLLIAQNLSEVQRDFHLFQESLDRTKNRLTRALNEVEDSSRKASQIRRRLDSLNLIENDLTTEPETGEDNLNA